MGVVSCRAREGRDGSADAAKAGEIFQTIGGGCSALSGRGDPGGQITGPSDVFRREDGAQISHQRLLSNGGKASGGTDLQPFDRGAIDRVNEIPEEDQLRD